MKITIHFKNGTIQTHSVTEYKDDGIQVSFVYLGATQRIPKTKIERIDFDKTKK